jgi:hypothetical protein
MYSSLRQWSVAFGVILLGTSTCPLRGEGYCAGQSTYVGCAGGGDPARRLVIRDTSGSIIDRATVEEVGMEGAVMAGALATDASLCRDANRFRLWLPFALRNRLL